MAAGGVGAPAHFKARAPALAADRVSALGAEPLGERGLALIAELDVGAGQPLERRGLAEIGRRRGEAGALLRDALEDKVALAARGTASIVAPRPSVRTFSRTCLTLSGCCRAFWSRFPRANSTIIRSVPADTTVLRVSTRTLGPLTTGTGASAKNDGPPSRRWRSAFK